MVVLASYQAGAAIDVQPKLIEVKGKELTTVSIINNSDHPEYVTVTLFRLLNPGVPHEKEQLETVGMSRNPQLYAYPFRVSLAQGQSKKIVLKPLTTVKQENVYRLEVKTVAALSGEAALKSTAGVAVKLSFSALVRQLPDKQSSDISISCRAQGVMLTATGTTRYKVGGMRTGGQTIEAFNVYPGTPIFVAGPDIEMAGKRVCR
ncbi:hypothetical protein GK011_20295 [Erwinia sp. J316]|uniref:Fimbria/pilus periplasmic chaperone n=2 Tax=Erwinia sorbitola TaxID=2681984 RepID=A0A6I6EU79_9GAMM|nr:hypothetical protein [Erwinia sorbitola]QGU89786.1 hypothetical protein GN242_20060 [Erwinia sorbitola]